MTMKPRFGAEVYEGESISWDADGLTFTATIHRDDWQRRPWEEEDGHGEVSDWTKRAKEPGELVLNEDRGSFRYYDFAGACKTALKDGWGVRNPKLPTDHPDAYKPLPGESKKAYAARAARADFERLRAWCNDEWCYIGVDVRVDVEGVEVVEHFEHALWGIESDCGDYITDVAHELAEEAAESARTQIASLAAFAATMTPRYVDGTGI